MAVEFYGDETVTRAVESGHGTGFILHAAFERQCGNGFEARQEVPEWRDEEPLECDSTEDGSDGEPWLVECGTQQDACRAEAEDGGEAYAW